MKIVTKPPREARKSKPNRRSTILLAQIALGGVGGVLIALGILRYLEVGVFRTADNTPVTSESRDQNQADSISSVPALKVEEQESRNARSISSAASGRLRDKALDARTPPSIAVSSESSSDLKPTGSDPPINASAVAAADPRTPIAKEALAEYLAMAKINAAAQAWWCDRAAFEFDSTGSLRFIDHLGKKGLYLPMTATETYLELESDSHQDRVRLFLDHAEIAREPFLAYAPFYPQGQWVVSSEQTGVDWFPKAIIDLNTALYKSRTSSKEYMASLFSMAHQLQTANKLKDIPFGFELDIERERFTQRGLVPWSAPLLPMTEKYLQECRKLHKNEDAGYNRIAQRLTSQREKLAKEYLEFHKWRNARSWPVAVLNWKDPASGLVLRQTLFRNGTVSDPYSKNHWKLTKDILEMDLGERRVRVRIGVTGKDFSLIGQEPPVTGTFVFDSERVAF